VFPSQPLSPVLQVRHVPAQRCLGAEPEAQEDWRWLLKVQSTGCNRQSPSQGQPRPSERGVLPWLGFIPKPRDGQGKQGCAFAIAPVGWAFSDSKWKKQAVFSDIKWKKQIAKALPLEVTHVKKKPTPPSPSTVSHECRSQASKKISPSFLLAK